MLSQVSCCSARLGPPRAREPQAANAPQPRDPPHAGNEDTPCDQRPVRCTATSQGEGGEEGGRREKIPPLPLNVYNPSFPRSTVHPLIRAIESNTSSLRGGVPGQFDVPGVLRLSEIRRLHQMVGGDRRERGLGHHEEISMTSRGMEGWMEEGGYQRH